MLACIYKALKFTMSDCGFIEVTSVGWPPQLLGVQEGPYSRISVFDGETLRTASRNRFLPCSCCFVCSTVDGMKIMRDV